jgi:hypothetical protein
VKKLRIALAILILAILGIAIWMRLWPALGGRIEGARLKRVQASPQWRDGKFRNPILTRTMLLGRRQDVADALRRRGACP